MANTNFGDSALICHFSPLHLLLACSNMAAQIPLVWLSSSSHLLSSCLFVLEPAKKRTNEKRKNARPLNRPKMIDTMAAGSVLANEPSRAELIIFNLRQQSINCACTPNIFLCFYLPTLSSTRLDSTRFHQVRSGVSKHVISRSICQPIDPRSQFALERERPASPVCSTCSRSKSAEFI